MKATMEFDRETKNTVRFKETDESEAAGAIGTIYLSKFAARSLGVDGKHPERITVTVEPA